jgi:hypothetical protein
VTTLVVHGWMADTPHATAGSASDPPRRERRLVIPISAVRDVTASAILLQIGDDAAMRHADLDPAAYAPPAADWQPPYPYTHAEVLLEPDRTNTAHGDSLGVLAKPEGVVEHDLRERPRRRVHMWLEDAQIARRGRGACSPAFSYKKENNQ